MTSPVMNLDLSWARKTITAAISAGFAVRLSVVVLGDPVAFEAELLSELGQFGGMPVCVTHG
jgi:hypothetical protein